MSTHVIEASELHPGHIILREDAPDEDVMGEVIFLSTVDGDVVVFAGHLHDGTTTKAEVLDAHTFLVVLDH